MELKEIVKALSHLIPDKLYIKLMYRMRTGKRLNLKNPKTFNEKLQWLKLHNRKPIFSKMVDKCDAKSYVAERLGEEYIIPTLGVWDKFEDIDFESLPEQFVLKCTNDSGGYIICKDKSELDIDAARKLFAPSMKTNFFWHGREWPYKAVSPRIIAEKYMIDDSVNELRDYKFFCFDGVARCMKVDFDRFIEHRANYYDPRTGELLGIGETVCPPDFDRDIVLPPNMETMLGFAEKLSEGLPFLRVDFYDANGKVYFGELTFYPASGFGPFIDDKWDELLGSWIKLPIDKEG